MNPDFLSRFNGVGGGGECRICTSDLNFILHPEKAVSFKIIGHFKVTMSHSKERLFSFSVQHCFSRYINLVLS